MWENSLDHHETQLSTVEMADTVKGQKQQSS